MMTNRHCTPVFWILHTCLNDMGCMEFCVRCGYCSNQCHDPDSDNEKCIGHNRDKRRKERECQNCVRRRNITTNESASNNTRMPERRVSAGRSAWSHENPPGPSHVNPPLRLWVHANKVHIRPVADTQPADDGVQVGEQELIPPHMRSKSNFQRLRAPEALQIPMWWQTCSPDRALPAGAPADLPPSTLEASSTRIIMRRRRRRRGGSLSTFRKWVQVS